MPDSLLHAAELDGSSALHAPPFVEPVTRVQTAEKTCAEPGCQSEGQYKSPIAKSLDGEILYRDFCKIHARAWNKRWNYFADMSNEQADALRHFLHTGHVRDDDTLLHQSIVHNYRSLNEEIARLSGGTKARIAGEKGLGGHKKPTDEGAAIAFYSVPMRLALRHLQLSTMPTDARALQQQFRQLAKRFHPDVMRSPKAKRQGAERLKQINAAYTYLKQQLGKTPAAAE